MAASRDIGEVLASLIEFMPEDCRQRLEWFANHAAYQPPEAHHDVWSAIQAWIFDRLNIGEGFTPPLRLQAGEEWKAKVLGLWSTKPVDRLVAEGLLVLSPYDAVPIASQP